MRQREPEHRTGAQTRRVTAVPLLWNIYSAMRGERFSFDPGVTGQGKTGRVNENEPPTMPRDPKPRRWKCGSEVQGWSLRSAGAGRGGHCGQMDTVASGSRGHPPRSYLTLAERGNPVEVRVALFDSVGRL